MSSPAGRINKLFGTDGGLMLTLYAGFPEDFDTDTPLLVTIDALEVPLYCERFERRGTAGAVATFADFDTQRRAQELIGREFRLDVEEEDDDEFYLEDLIGFSVTGIETTEKGMQAAAGSDAPSDPSARDSQYAPDEEQRPATCGQPGTSGKKDTPIQQAFEGMVTDYYDSETNPLFELEIGGRKVLVPAAEEFIAHIDFERRTIRMVLPEGLLQLN